MRLALPDTELWINRPAPLDNPHQRLFCFPHAGSGAAQFRPWADLLPFGVELCSVRLPGRESRRRETPSTNLSETVDAIREAIAPLLDRPFVLFGHSMGAMLGFELARRLASYGDPEPDHLIVSGRRAPHLPDGEPAIHHLPEAALLAELKRRYGPTSTVLLDDPDLRELFLPVLRADLAAVETYEYAPGESLGCPITAFGGVDDSRASVDELLGWRLLTRSEFVLHQFAGDHFFHQVARRQVLARLSAVLQS